MIVSNKKKFIFVSIPKTGTTSIEKVLSKYEDAFPFVHYKKHAPFIEVDYLPLSYYKFCFFRNSWDQFVSMYQYHNDNNHNYLGIDYNVSFEDYIKVAILSPEYGFKTQYEYIVGTSDVFVYKFEEMDWAWEEICKKLNISDKLPHLNKGTHPHYSTYYTEKTRDIVAKMCAREIKMMGYTFDNI